MSDYFGYRTGIVGTIHIKHTIWGSFIEKGISPLNFIEKQYALGNIKPTYPLPAIHGSAFICPECVTICDVDEWSEEPIITWWNEEFAERRGLQMPEDHGIPYWRGT